jgi:hypothetical protein
MRTTIDVPDELFRRAKQAAAAEGVSLREVMVRALSGHLERPAGVPYRFDWKTADGEWPRDLPLHSREELEEYLGGWRADLYG